MNLRKCSIFFSLILLAFCSLMGQSPILNSKSGSNYVIYLDFDGAYVGGTFWNSLFTSGAGITLTASSQNSTGRTNIWKQVSEDLRAFDINVTTDSTVYNSAASGQRMWVIITPSSSWFGVAGGVAFLGSFTWSSRTPCFVFENYLSSFSEYISEAASHEVGHTFDLLHQSTYSACTKTNEYNPGAGSGQIDFAPIMGNGYNANVTVWYNRRHADSCYLNQDDLGVILSGNGFGLNTDEYGNTTGSATTLPLNSTSYDTSGIITDSNDVDVFRFTLPSANTVSIAATPFNLSSSNNLRANLDIRLELLDSNGNLIVASDSSSILNAFINNRSLTAGRYFIRIDGVGSSNYTDYSSIGRYNLRITNTIPLSIENFKIEHTFKNNINTIIWEYLPREKFKSAELWVSKNNFHFSKLQDLQLNQKIEFTDQEKVRYAVIKVATTENTVDESPLIPLSIEKQPAVIWDKKLQKIQIFGQGNPFLYQLQLINAEGKTVLNGIGNSYDISLPNGIYYYKLKTHDFFSGKILIAK